MPEESVDLRDGSAPGGPPAETSPAPGLTIERPGALDPMLAVGQHFIIESEAGGLRFLDKSGSLLPKHLGGVPVEPGIGAFFAGFTADTDGGGSFNYANINDFTGFPHRCETYPATYGNHFCIGEFYDARVYFDRFSSRFWVISAARNPVWTSFDDPKFHSEHPGMCGFSQLTLGDSPVKNYTGDTGLCVQERRYVALAVSKTEDPRDGFHQYMLTDNLPADWPWMAVHGDHVVITHKGGTPNGWPASLPVAEVLAAHDLLVGSRHPALYRLGPEDLGGRTWALAPTQPDEPDGPTVVLTQDGDNIGIYGIPAGGSGWSSPGLIKAAVHLADAPSVFQATRRAGKLYLVGPQVVETLADGSKRYSVHVVRLALEHTVGGFYVSTAPTSAFLDLRFGRNALEDAPGDRISYVKPTLAVNEQGDMLFGYLRSPFVSAQALFPEARYSYWRAVESRPRRSWRLRQGEAPTAPKAKIDYLTAVVDPTDDTTFWVALAYVRADGQYDTVLARVPGF